MKRRRHRFTHAEVLAVAAMATVLVSIAASGDPDAGTPATERAAAHESATCTSAAEGPAGQPSRSILSGDPESSAPSGTRAATPEHAARSGTDPDVETPMGERGGHATNSDVQYAFHDSGGTRAKTDPVSPLVPATAAERHLFVDPAGEIRFSATAAATPGNPSPPGD